MSEELNFVERARREKLEALAASGVNPFAYSFDRSHKASEALTAMESVAADAEGPKVACAGRIIAWRAHGKTVFAHLADSSGKIQLYFRKDQLGDTTFSQLDNFDLGDIVGVRGPLFRTRTGETTVRVESFEILAK
jgi:lysyl-tRNA synthetase class 2